MECTNLQKHFPPLVQALRLQSDMLLAMHRQRDCLMKPGKPAGKSVGKKATTKAKAKASVK